MSYRVEHSKRDVGLELQKNIVVNDLDLYRVELDKKVCKENSETGVSYLLAVKCPEKGVDMQAVLPHEVLTELNEMIKESLSF